jgi:hypothetical protein
MGVHFIYLYCPHFDTLVKRSRYQHITCGVVVNVALDLEYFSNVLHVKCNLRLVLCGTRSDAIFAAMQVPMQSKSCPER